MKYPIKLYPSKIYLLMMVCLAVFIGVILLGCLAIIMSQGPIDPSKFENVRAAIDNPDYIPPVTSEFKSAIDFKHIFALILLALGGLLMLGCAYVFYKLLKSNPHSIKFDPQGLDCFMGFKRPYLYINWADIKDVELYKKRTHNHTIKGVALILKDTKAFQKGSIVNRDKFSNEPIFNNMLIPTDMIVIPYMRQGKLSHKDLVEFTKIEFLKYKTNSNNYKHRGKKLFGQAS